MRTMSTFLPKKSFMKNTILYFFILLMSFNLNANAQGNKTFIAGSYIINMGVHTGNKTNDVKTELKPWGMVYHLLKNYNIPIYVVINPSKAKDSADFTYNGKQYKGGTFIIDKKYISAKIKQQIDSFKTLGVLCDSTTSNLTVNTTFRYTVVPRWTLDSLNGTALAAPFFANAGIPTSSYDYLSPSKLATCNDIFVMPHADPSWAVHGNLYNWNKQYKGAIWLGCHAGSALHNTYNPNDISQQMNFLTTKYTSAPVTAVYT